MEMESGFIQQAVGTRCICEHDGERVERGNNSEQQWNCPGRQCAWLEGADTGQTFRNENQQEQMTGAQMRADRNGAASPGSS